ncbi:hypothetical protein HDU76_001029 [Blyttiomyces sp. JEL0837]|nr:hypothetical protein HDU76_001029 [Blyttiomyces sp. JEL0837]
MQLTFHTFCKLVEKGVTDAIHLQSKVNSSGINNSNGRLEAIPGGGSSAGSGNSPRGSPMLGGRPGRMESPALVKRSMRRVSSGRVRPVGKMAACYYAREGSHKLRFTVEARLRADVAMEGLNGSTMGLSVPTLTKTVSAMSMGESGNRSINNLNSSMSMSVPTATPGGIAAASGVGGLDGGAAGTGTANNTSSGSGTGSGGVVAAGPGDKIVSLSNSGSGILNSGTNETSITVTTSASDERIADTGSLSTVNLGLGSSNFTGGGSSTNLIPYLSIEDQAREVKDAITSMVKSMPTPMPGTPIIVVFNAIIEHENPTGGPDYRTAVTWRTQTTTPAGKEKMEARQAEMEAAYKAQGVSLESTVPQEQKKEGGLFGKLFRSSSQRAKSASSLVN